MTGLPRGVRAWHARSHTIALGEAEVGELRVDVRPRPEDDLERRARAPSRGSARRRGAACARRSRTAPGAISCTPQGTYVSTSRKPERADRLEPGAPLVRRMTPVVHRAGAQRRRSRPPGRARAGGGEPACAEGARKSRRSLSHVPQGNITPRSPKVNHSWSDVFGSAWSTVWFAPWTCSPVNVPRLTSRNGPIPK